MLDPLIVLGVTFNSSIVPDFLNLKLQRGEAADLRTMEFNERQRVVTAFCNYVEVFRPVLANEHPGSFDVEYADKSTLKLPIWLRDGRGHNLMAIYKGALHPTIIKENIITSNYDKLTTMLTTVLSEFIPKELSIQFVQLSS